MKILILGGTTEASRLAQRLAAEGWDATLSLAGRTRDPAPQPVPVRIGGFGGVAGLADYLRAERVGALIDATHPFAAQITRHAAEAARLADVPHLAIVRPEWQAAEQDRWTVVATMDEAARALGTLPRRVLLTVGKQALAPFLGTPHHYVIRSVEMPDTVPEGAEVITARGPFAVADELALLQSRGIEVLVTKNAGGSATQAKLEAARALGLAVVMVARPALPPGLEVVRTAEAALGWLVFHAGTLRFE